MSSLTTTDLMVRELAERLEVPVRFDSATREIHACGVRIGRIAPDCPEAIAKAFGSSVKPWMTIVALSELVVAANQLRALMDFRAMQSGPPGGEVER